MENIKPKYENKFKEYNCCVIIPTYNNAQVIKKVIDDVLNYTSNIIIVNDGSTDNTSRILGDYKHISKVEYNNNRGKGFALKQGFLLAEKLGYNNAISIDSDGQHYADDLIRFINSIDKSPDSIIIGVRNVKVKTQDGSSSFANKFSNFWFWAETGIKHPDTQSGYRLYPIKKINKLKYFTNRYEFEIEVIVRNAWRGIDVSHVPVKVYYPDKEERISHFRPAKDFFRISILNTILFITALIYGLPARLINKLRKKSIKNITKEIFKSNDSNLRLSVAVGFGMFMGIVPIWGWQLITAIALAHLFKLNKPAVIISANISIPPMIPLILFLSFYTGNIILGTDKAIPDFTSNLSFDTFKNDLYQYIIGSIIFAIIAGLVSGFISYFIFKKVRKKNV